MGIASMRLTDRVAITVALGAHVPGANGRKTLLVLGAGLSDLVQEVRRGVDARLDTRGVARGSAVLDDLVQKILQLGRRVVRRHTSPATDAGEARRAVGVPHARARRRGRRTATKQDQSYRKNASHRASVGEWHEDSTPLVPRADRACSVPDVAPSRAYAGLDALRVVPSTKTSQRGAWHALFAGCVRREVQSTVESIRSRGLEVRAASVCGRCVRCDVSVCARTIEWRHDDRWAVDVDVGRRGRLHHFVVAGQALGIPDHGRSGPARCRGAGRAGQHEQDDRERTHGRQLTPLRGESVLREAR